MNKSRKLFFILYLLFTANISCATDSLYIANHYNKKEYTIPMRDGIKLFTAVYTPKDTKQKYPIILFRTPYNVSPYGEHSFPSYLGPSMYFTYEGYIFVYQDVRGRFMSEGVYENMRPNREGDSLDESRDTYDTIEWLLKNIPNNNGKVGMFGISYPGFYTSAAMIDPHPALIAVSPQAPIANWFGGDDWHHNGAFMLPHAFNFNYVFGKPYSGLHKDWPENIDYKTPDGYKFFLEMGTLANSQKYYKHEIPFWDTVFAHPDYDNFWKERNLLPHLKNIKPAVLVVGGWFDAENLYGAINTYKSTEVNSPNNKNILVMGPWFHGGWGRSTGEMLGNINFGEQTGKYFQEQIELTFFNYYLKGKGKLSLAEATAFETGSNKWKYYTEWPPKNTIEKKIYLHSGDKLSFNEQKENANYDEYVSDPNKPVPYTAEITVPMNKTYLVEDQRFVSSRQDVISYTSEILDKDIIAAGTLQVQLFISTTGTDADFVVKLIDVFPEEQKDNEPNPCGVKMGGFEMLVRGDVMRAKYRNGFDNPEPLKPGEVTRVEFALQDINHCFQKGHKIMVQVQSSWFPLIDRNPQKFVNIYEASEKDFSKQTHRIYHNDKYPSGLILKVLE